MDTGITVMGGIYAQQVLRLDRLPKPGEIEVGREPRMVLGGSGASQARVVARLGGQVGLVGQVGNDETGHWIVNHLNQAGVDVARLTRHPTAVSGLKLMLLNEYDQAHTVVVPGANSLYSPECLESLQPAIARARYLLLTLELPMAAVEQAAQWAKEAGAIVILSPSPPHSLSSRLLACLDYLTPSEEELAFLTDAPLEDFTRSLASLKAAELRAQGVKKVLVKLAGKGVLLVGEQREHLWRASTSAALDLAKTGDVFNAAFALALARNQNELSAGRYALAAVNSARLLPGEPPFLPTGAEIDHVMRRLRQRQIRELEAMKKAVKR